MLALFFIIAVYFIGGHSDALKNLAERDEIEASEGKMTYRPEHDSS